MGAETSRDDGSYSDAGEIVVVSSGRTPAEDELDPILKKLNDIKSVLPLLASGQVSWQDQVEAELEISDEDALAGDSLSSASTARTLQLFKTWLQSREREVIAKQQEALSGVGQTEALAVAAMKGATRAGHFARVSAGDLKTHAGNLEVELRRARNLVKGAVERRDAALRTAARYARLLAVLENASFVPYSSSFSALASPSPRSSLLFAAPPSLLPAPGLTPGAARSVLQATPSPPASPLLRPWESPPQPPGGVDYPPLTVRVGGSVGGPGASPSGHPLPGHSSSSTPTHPSPLGPSGAAGPNHSSPRLGPGSGGSQGNAFFGPAGSGGGGGGGRGEGLPHPSSPQPLKPRRSPNESPRISRQSVPVSPTATGLADPGEPPFLSLDSGPASPSIEEAERRAGAGQGAEARPRQEPPHVITAHRVLVPPSGIVRAPGPHVAAWLVDPAGVGTPPLSRRRSGAEDFQATAADIAAQIAAAARASAAAAATSSDAGSRAPARQSLHSESPRLSRPEVSTSRSAYGAPAADDGGGRGRLDGAQPSAGAHRAPTHRVAKRSTAESDLWWEEAAAEVQPQAPLARPSDVLRYKADVYGHIAAEFEAAPLGKSSAARARSQQQQQGGLSPTAQAAGEAALFAVAASLEATSGAGGMLLHMGEHHLGGGGSAAAPAAGRQ